MLGPITLEVVTPVGYAGARRGLDEVVMRRRETRFEQGSEVAVFPGHGPMLVRIPACEVRFTGDRGEGHINVSSGFAEVHDNLVTLLVSQAGPWKVAPTRAVARVPTG